MGMTIKAELHYGFTIYDADGGWEIAEAGEFGEYTPDWWDEDGDDTGEQITTQLLKASGFTETYGEAEDYWSRRLDAEDSLPVELEHSGYQGGQLMLVVKDREYSAYAGDATTIDPAEMAAQNDEVANAHLADALRTLGITPVQSKPAWLLTCYYG